MYLGIGGGDGVSMSAILHLLRDNQGFRRVLQGTSRIGVAVDADRGFVYDLNILDANGQKLPTLGEVLDDLDAAFIWRVMENKGEYAFVYDSENDVLVKVKLNITIVFYIM